jgi:glucosamine--fructose-6-phosphate aminotransferase (isomerizing)
VAATFLADVADQPRVLRSHLDRRWARPSFESHDRIIISGMGASLSASYPLWFELASQGLPVWHLDTSALLDGGVQLVRGNTLLVLVSQSGRTAEILALLDRLPPARPRLVAITNDETSPLAAAADAVVTLEAGDEVAVSTKTHVSTRAAIHLIAATEAERLPRLRSVAEAADRLEAWLGTTAEHLMTATRMTAGLGNTFLVGRGESLAIAEYGALALKEAARHPAEALSGAQFRHGPIELVEPGCTVILCSDRPADGERDRRLAADIGRVGGTVLRAAPPGPGMTAGQLPAMQAREGFPGAVSGIAALQIVAAGLGAGRGLTPGTMRNGAKVTTTL